VPKTKVVNPATGDKTKTQKQQVVTSQPTSLDQAFSQVNDELLKMFLKKHKDYGKGNILAVGEIGIVLRITEKIERLKNLLLKGDAPTNESIEETFIDIAVYANLAILLRRGWFEKLEVNPEVLDKI
jgi:hypothetical protein